MARTVGIDTDDFAVTAVELEGSYRRTRLARSHVTALSGDQSQAERKMAAAAAVAETLREHRFKGDRVLGHPCDEAVLRKITMPFSGREAIRRIIKSEVENAIHSHSIDDMVVDFHVLGEAEEGARVLAAAVPKVSLRSMLTSLQQEGVEPERVELDTMALLRVAHWCGAFEADGYPPEAADAVEPAGDGGGADPDEVPALPAVDESARLTAVLDLGARSTRVLLVSDGKLVDMRTIRLGDAAVIDAVARHHQITFDQAKDAVATCLVTGGECRRVDRATGYDPKAAP